MKKKGFILGTTADIIAFGIYVGIFFIFYLIFYFGAKPITAPINQISSVDAINLMHSDMALITFLRQPVTLEGQQVEMADLVVWSARNKDDVLLKQKTKELLSRLYNPTFYEVEISNLPSYSSGLGDVYNSTSKAVIPTLYDDMPTVMIQLSLGGR